MKLAPPSWATFSVAVPRLPVTASCPAVWVLMPLSSCWLVTVGRCVGIQRNELVHHDIIDCIENMKRPFDQELYNLSTTLF